MSLGNRTCLPKNLRCTSPNLMPSGYGYETYAERAEKLNGRTAMLGFIAAIVSYATTVVYFSLVLSDSDV